MNPHERQVYEWIQDTAFYTAEFQKEDVENISQMLAEVVIDNSWDWSTGYVEDGYAIVLNDLQDELEGTYDVPKLEQLTQRLLDRHTVFWGIVNHESVTWERDENLLHASDAAWTQLIQADPRNAWYQFLGEPLWVEIAFMFEGKNFHAFEFPAEDDAANSSQSSDSEED